MEALILSCSTGGGHHVAAEAVQEALIRRGHRADMLDPYTLCGNHMDEKVGDCYIKCAQRAPGFFGFIYLLGNLYRRLPFKSPVYLVNRRMAERMQQFLEARSYDLIITTHIFPGEILTYLRKKGVALPKILYIATDYTCIPFTEEIDCDYYLVPEGTEQEFRSRGIPSERVIPMGIPVRQGFREEMSREKAVESLGLTPDKHYILLAGGSIGAGKILQAMKILREYLEKHEDTVLIVIAGTNKKLYDKLKEEYGEARGIMLLRRTECMAEYLKACDLYLSKPGGISSTEAAVANIPLIHISPIPGCETKNKRFFEEAGMSIYVSNLRKGLISAMELLQDERAAGQMKEAQRKQIDPLSAEKIADFAEEVVQRKGSSRYFYAGYETKESAWLTTD